MKDKILMLIIGVLLGAVITAGCFLIFSKQNKGFNGDMPQRGDMENMIPGEFGEGKRGNRENTTVDSNTQTNTQNEI